MPRLDAPLTYNPPPSGRPGRRRVAEDPFEQSKHIRCLVYRIHHDMDVPAVARLMGVSPRTVVNWTRLALSYYGHPEIKVLRARLAAMGKTLD